VTESGTEPLLLNKRRAARRIGVSARTLGRRAAEHPLYRPAFRPTGSPTPTHYHADQIRWMLATWSGAIDVETAWLRWQIEIHRLAGSTS